MKKNHSSANLFHNHKLFSGDMLSFIKVGKYLFLITLFTQCIIASFTCLFLSE